MLTCIIIALDLITLIAACFLHLCACFTCSSAHALTLHPLLAHHCLCHVDVYSVSVSLFCFCFLVRLNLVLYLCFWLLLCFCICMFLFFIWNLFTSHHLWMECHCKKNHFWSECLIIYYHGPHKLWIITGGPQLILFWNSSFIFVQGSLVVRFYLRICLSWSFILTWFSNLN